MNAKLNRRTLALFGLMMSVIGLAGTSASAQLNNVLLGIPWTNQVNMAFDGPSSFTDGNTLNGAYGHYNNGGGTEYQSSVDYTLTSPKLVDGFGIYNTDTTRRVPKSVQLDVFSSNTFTTVTATRTIPLADQSFQQYSFAPVTAQYVRFTFPFGTTGYYPTRSDAFYMRASELQLFIPEPGMMGVIALATVAMLRRGRRTV